MMDGWPLFGHLTDLLAKRLPMLFTSAGGDLFEGLLMLNVAAVLRTLELELDPRYRLPEAFRPTPCPDHQFKLKVRRVRHESVALLA